MLLCFLTDTVVECFEDENARAAVRAQIDNEHELKNLNTEKLEIKKYKNEK